MPLSGLKEMVAFIFKKGSDHNEQFLWPVPRPVGSIKIELLAVAMLSSWEDTARARQ